MSDDAKPLTLYEKETLFFQDKDLLKKICRHVASGGSLIDLAKMHEIRYCDIMQWLRADSERSKQYEMALSDRSEWAIELALRELHEVVQGLSEVNHEGELTRAAVRDRLKAVELIGKTKALWRDRVEQNHVVTLEDLVLGSMREEENKPSSGDK